MYIKFEKELKDAFKSNRVRREDQLKKLRDCLKSQPKLIIPESTRNIDDAFAILSNVWGSLHVSKSKENKIVAFGNISQTRFKVAVPCEATDGVVAHDGAAHQGFHGPGR